MPFVDELGTVCGEVPLEYGFEVLMYNFVILSSAPSVRKKRW